MVISQKNGYPARTETGLSVLVAVLNVFYQILLAYCLNMSNFFEL
jgi:hypothetical protein